MRVYIYIYMYVQRLKAVMQTGISGLGKVVSQQDWCSRRDAEQLSGLACGVGRGGTSMACKVALLPPRGWFYNDICALQQPASRN